MYVSVDHDLNTNEPGQDHEMEFSDQLRLKMRMIQKNLLVGKEILS